MIVVLDTNVIVSALLAANGSPAEVIKRWEADEFDVVVSPPLLDELERAIQYPRVAKYLGLSQEAISSFLRRFAMVATVVEPQIRLEILEKDPDDNRVLECAIAGGASYIITGDKHLLERKEYQGIMILPPAGFLAFLEAMGKKKSK